MRGWPLLLVASACLPEGRRDGTTVVVVRADAQPPYAVEGGEVTLARALIGLGALSFRDTRGFVFGGWADQRAANLLGPPGPHGTVTFYDGEAMYAEFHLVGDPALELEGTYHDTDGTAWPFAFAFSGDELVSGVRVDFDFDAAHPLASLDWEVPLTQALAQVTWPPKADRNEVHAQALRTFLVQPDVWSFAPAP